MTGPRASERGADQVHTIIERTEHMADKPSIVLSVFRVLYMASICWAGIARGKPEVGKFELEECYQAVAAHSAAVFGSPAVKPLKPMTPRLKLGRPFSSEQCNAIGNQPIGTIISNHHLRSAF